MCGRCLCVVLCGYVLSLVARLSTAQVGQACTSRMMILCAQIGCCVCLVWLLCATPRDKRMAVPLFVRNHNAIYIRFRGWKSTDKIVARQEEGPATIEHLIPASPAGASSRWALGSIRREAAEHFVSRLGQPLHPNKNLCPLIGK